MKVLIRTDSSRLIGSGHVVRCLTLAGYLGEYDFEVEFVCRDLPGNLIDLIETRGYRVHRLAAPVGYPENRQAGKESYTNWLGVSEALDATETERVVATVGGEIEWLLVDHYGLARGWQNALRGKVKRIAMIDDLANREHDCDLLIDQNFYLDLQTRYDSLLPKSCRKLLGPEFAILRPEFIEARPGISCTTGKIERILVFFGGYDSTGETVKLLEGLQGRSHPAIEIVIGKGNDQRDMIERLSNKMDGVTCHTEVDRMSELMLAADFAFGGGGTTTWERCFLGLPTATVTVADNQRVMLQDMAQQGALIHLGNADKVTPERYADCLQQMLSSPDKVRSISDVALGIMGDRLLKERCPAAATMAEISHFENTVAR